MLYFPVSSLFLLLLHSMCTYIYMYIFINTYIYIPLRWQRNRTEKWIAKCCVLSFLCVYLKGRLADVAPADFFRVNPCLFCLAFLWLSLNWRERLCRWMGWVWVPYINQMEKTDIQSCTPRHQPPSKACILSRTTCGAQAAKCIISLKSLQSDQSAQKIFLVYYAEL